MPWRPAFTPVSIVVHACVVSGWVVERRTPRLPDSKTLAMLGSSPTSIIGSMTSNVAASSPITVSAVVQSPPVRRRFRLAHIYIQIEGM